MMSLVLNNRALILFTVIYGKLKHNPFGFELIALAFGIPKFYIAPYDKIKHELVKVSSNCDVKSGLRSHPSIN